MRKVEYKETRNHYEILEENAQMKDPNTGEWVKCVIYRQTENFDHVLGVWYPVLDSMKMTFVREVDDFWNKFDLISNF